jgi:hypothetical protein
MNHLWRVVAAASATAGVCLIGGPAAFAHEQRQVGAYQLTVGWAHEPTYVGEVNAVQLIIHDAKGNPIDDIGSPPTLQVEAIFGGQTSSPLDLEPSFDPDTGLGNHGEFDAALAPTAAGNYTFHFFGTLNGQKVDERFNSGPTTFNTVEEPTSVEFPTKVPALPDLATLTGRLSGRVDHAAALASATTHRADSAHTLGVIGVALGGTGLVAGIGLGGAALRMARRRVATSSQPEASTVSGG